MTNQYCQLILYFTNKKTNHIMRLVYRYFHINTLIHM